MTKRKPEAMVAMRLIDMVWVHPSQDNSRVCARCGERIGLYPTGQEVLRRWPKAELICFPCAKADPQADDVDARPAGSWDEIAREIKDSVRPSKA